MTRRWVGGLGVGALGASITLLALLAANGHRPLVRVPGPHPDWLLGPLRDLALAPQPPRVFDACLVVATAGWLASRWASPRWALAAGLGVLVVVLLAPPLLSGDVFSYISQGRLGALHDRNPYQDAPSAVPADPALPHVGWRDTTSPYGPVFTFISYAVSGLGVAGALWALKVLTFVAALACAALTARIARQRGVSPLGASAFVVANPLFSLYAVGGAHNDLIGLALALAAVTWTLDGRRLAPAVGVLAVGVKASAAPLLAFLVVGSRAPWRAARVAAVALAALTAGTLVLFGRAGLDGALSLGNADRVVRLSLPTVVLGLDRARLWHTGLAAAGAAGALALVVATARHRLDPIAGAGWATLLLLATSTLLTPWYVVWALPLAAVSRDRWLQAATIAFSVFVLGTHAVL